jgi:FtsH-binding integral membrane protein
VFVVLIYGIFPMNFLPDASEQPEPTLSDTPAEVDDDYFIAKTYGYLFAALTAMTLIGFASYGYLPRSWLAALSTADSVVWLLCLRWRWRRPLGLVFPLFTLITGMELGELAHLYPAVFFSASAFTLLASGGLSLFVLITKCDFSSLAGFFCVVLIVLLAAGLLSWHYHQHSVLFGLTGFCVAVGAGSILYDTSQTLQGSDSGLTPGLAAFQLILDLVLAQTWIVEYFGRNKSVEE